MRNSFLGFVILSLPCLLAAQAGFWAPVVPPRAQYRIDGAFDAAGPRLKGTETIVFRNSTPRAMARLALDWSIGTGKSVTLTANGKPAALLLPPGAKSVSGPLLLQLPEPLAPGAPLDLRLEFINDYGREFDPAHGVLLQGWYPKLWWGFGTLDDYTVRLKPPEGAAVVASGVWNPASGLWTGSGIRDFAAGIYSAQRYTIDRAQAGDVQVTAVYTVAGAKCGRLVLKTAVDAITFYRGRFGFYPHKSLTLIPGGDYPAGGYPAATALVVIHGEEQMEKKPEAHFRWITAHEIGHMYWSQYVLAAGADDLNWLMIGLGIFADREYRRARAIAAPIGNLPANYIGGMKDGIDTTLDLTDEQQEVVEWDYNNIAEHGKSSAMMDALESTIGAAVFDRAYRRILREFHGRRLTVHDFERVCEEESSEDLGWFFESWTRSNQYTRYRAVRLEPTQSGGVRRSPVEVISEGSRPQRVPVVATFEDGSRQTLRTDRLAGDSVLTFESESPLKELKLDPGNTLWLLDFEPPLSAAGMTRKIAGLELTGSAEAALALLPRAIELRLATSRPWRRLGLMLYDGKHYQEALDCFRRAYDATTDQDYRFLALVWQGQLLDLLNKRADAIAAYQAAKATGSTYTFRHDQYSLAIDQKWVEQRLATPFERK
ncbi:MAG: hypothetical protein ACLQPN_19560 [Bryobacteraceae bacterium]